MNTETKESECIESKCFEIGNKVLSKSEMNPKDVVLECLNEYINMFIRDNEIKLDSIVNVQYDINKSDRSLCDYYWRASAILTYKVEGEKR